MNKSPLVSILTPSCNMAEYIALCIESVLAQDYPHIEHIIQDGASTDGTLGILKRCGGKINWVSAPDNGQSDGLNKALQRCKGDIIIILNADDELLPHACSWGVEQMSKYQDAAVIYGDQYCINGRGGILSNCPGPNPYNFEQIFCVEKIIPAQTAFIRREFLEKAGFYIDTTLKTCPDYELWVRIGLKYPIKYAKGVIAKYREHPGSEGHNATMIPKMVEAKKKVQDRVFSNASAPSGLVNLRTRSYSGLLYWEAALYKSNGDYRKALRGTLHSISMYPSFNKIVNLLKLIFKQLKIFTGNKKTAKTISAIT